MTYQPIGVSLRAELLYRTLLRRPHWRPADLAGALGWSEDDVHKAVSELRSDDLVATSADDHEAVRAVEPRLALPAMTARRLHTRATDALPSPVYVERLIALHEPAVEGCRHNGLPTCLDEVTSIVERLVAGARSDVVLLVPVYAAGSFEFSPLVASAALRRRCALRAVWRTNLLNLPAVRDHASWLATQQAAPRTLDHIPARAIILDRSVAVVIRGELTAHVLRSSSALDSLCQLADRLWDKATEVKAPAPVPSNRDYSQRSETVLRLLADGMTDDAVARRMGISVRTVRNDVAAVMACLDARSRFQAGVRAAQLGLL